MNIFQTGYFDTSDSYNLLITDINSYNIKYIIVFI